MGVVSVTLYLLIVYVCIFEGLYHLCNWLCIFHWFRLARVSVWSCLCEVVSLKLQHAGYTYQYVSLLRVGFSRTTESAVEGDCEKITCSRLRIGAASSSVGLMVTRAITITARSAPASDGEALHMNAYHTSNLIHVLRLPLDPAKSSRTASCRTRCCIMCSVGCLLLLHGVLRRMPVWLAGGPHD